MGNSHLITKKFKKKLHNDTYAITLRSRFLLILACVLIRTERGRFDEVVDRIRQFKEVKKAFAVLGRYDVVADLEADNYQSLSDIILRMGRIAGIVFTETLVEVKKC